MRTIAVVNQKGGCGKTTTSINLAAFLAGAGRRTLVVDMDPQGHATLGLRAGATPSRTVYDLFVPPPDGEVSLGDIACPVGERLDLAAADVVLSAAPEALAGVEGREDILSRQIANLGDRYDYVIIDCPPGVGLLTFNALKAASEAIIPVEPSFYSLHGIAKLLETFDMLASNTGHDIAWRALVTMFSGRTQFARDVVEELRRHVGERCYDTVIRHSVKLAEAASHGLPITRYHSRSVGYEDYSALAVEVLRAEAALAPRDAATPTVSAPRPTAEGVVFTIEAPQARHVQLVGDFNGWIPDGNEMLAGGRVWTRVLQLEPGTYRYRYVVDGEWQNDPLNAQREPSPFGGYNSVLVLGDRTPEQA
jgi:chromosome partitioning protein